MSLLDVQNLCVSIEGKQVLKNLSININPGETHVLMGPNGAGKSTPSWEIQFIQSRTEK